MMTREDNLISQRQASISSAGRELGSRLIWREIGRRLREIGSIRLIRDKKIPAFLLERTDLLQEK
jgi:hypothetical protein